MTTISRRSLLGGMLATAGAGAVAPVLRAPAARAETGRVNPPGSRPFPHLPEGTDTLPQIEHVVVLMMENHSFDAYFGMLGRGDGYTLDGHGRPTNSVPGNDGKPVRVYRSPTSCQAHYDVSQSWDATHRSWNGGRMDGFVRATSTASMAYWTDRDLPFYWALAKTFPLCDRWFCSVMAQTYPNRRFLLAATALGQVGDPFPSPTDPAPPNGTIYDRLNAHGITWRDYFVDLPTTGLFPSIIEHDPANLAPATQFFADAAAGTLPAYSLVDPEGWQGSEENPQDVHTGAYYAWLVIDAVLRSPKWSSTVLVLCYDEHGGYYDHVPPPRAVRPDRVRPQVPAGDTYGDLYSWYGVRVPAVVVSPFAKRDYVSHVVHDQTSILRLLETKWNLPAMTYRDANASNLLDCLDLRAAEPPFAHPPTLPPAILPSTTPGCYTQDPDTPVGGL